MTNNFISFLSLSLDNGSRMTRHCLGIDSTIPRKLFTLLFALLLGVGQMWGASTTVALTTSNSNLSSSGITVNSNIAITFGEGTYNSLPSVGSTYTKIYSGNTITFTPTNATITQVVMTASSNDYIKTWTKSAGTSITVNQKTATWTGSQTSAFTLTNSASAQARITQIAITYTVNASYTVTWTINPAAGGTISPTSGTSTTVTPNSEYTYGSPAYTVTSGTATVSQSTNTFTATPTTNCSIRINMVEKPKYTVTLMDDNDTRTQASYGAAVTLPSRDGCAGYTFVGWTKTWTSTQASWTTTAPTTINAGSYTPTADENLYPVYTKTESGGTTDKTKTETFENQTAEQVYNSTKTYNAANSNAGLAWSMYYGCVSATGYLTTSKSAHMRWYSSATSNYPYIKTTTAVSGLQTITFNAAVQNTNIKMKVEKSTNGSTWTAVASNIAMSTSKDEYSYAINGTIGTGYYIRIGVDGANSTAPSSGNWTFRVDDVKFDYTEAGGSTTSYISVPNCCQPLGSINGSISVANNTINEGGGTATWTWSGETTGISKNILKVYDTSDNLVKTIDNISSSATSQGISGLDPCTTYYVTLTTVAKSGYCDGAEQGKSNNFTTNGWAVHYTGGDETEGALLSNVTKQSGAAQACLSEDYVATFTANNGYQLPTTIVVYIAGVEVDVNDAYTWSISNGTGTLTVETDGLSEEIDVRIIGECVEPEVTDPADADYYVGDTPDALSVTATLASGTLTYLWKVSTDGGTVWGDAAGTNNAATYSGASLTTGSATTLKFKCIVGNSEGGCSVESGVATITVSTASYFANGATVFIQAKSQSESAWADDACVKAWFHQTNNDGAAQTTYWLFDATGTDDGKKVFATIVPASGDLSYLDIQRFPTNCEGDMWNYNGGVSKSTGGTSNTVRSEGSGESKVSWNNDALTMDLYGDPSNDEWATSLASFSDQGAGVWTATYENYAPANAAGETQNFKVKTNYNGWIGNTGENENATLDGMHVGSTYNVTATLNVIDHSLVMSKEYVKGTVHYDRQDHGSAIADVEDVAAGSKISAPAEPSETGWDFGGWFTDEGCTEGNEWDFDNDVVNETMTLYAKWSKHNYTISTTLNNVTASPSIPAKYEYTGSAAGLSYTISAADGYRLPASITVTGTSYTWSNGTLTLTGTITSNVSISITAVQTHTITWSAKGVETTTTVDAGNKLVLPEDEPTTCNAGYSTFIGWYKNAAGTAEDPSDNVSGTKADADHTPTGDETYYAVWGNGELVGGWQKVTSIAVGDVVIFVQETASKEMSNIALINTNMCGIATAYSTSPAGTYPLTIETGNGGSGYSFKTSANTYLSWSSNNTLTTSDTKNNASSWTISTSTDGNFKFANVATTERIMQFNNNSGQHRWACYGNDNQTAFQIYKQTTGATGFISNCCEEWTATAKYGESNVINVNDVVAVTVTGTVHGTASYESDDTDVLTVASDGKITGKKAGSATVTISWPGADGYCAYETTVDVTVNGTITVTYNKNDGSLSPATTSQNATSNSAFDLDANTFSRTGYSFLGWATTPSGAKEYNNSQEDVEFAEDITLYAVWSINSHAITLNQPTGITIEATGAANLASVEYGTSITLSATENDGYVFTGWSTEDVDLANTNPVVFTMPDKDVAVTATYSTYTWDVASPRYTVTTAPKISYNKVEKFSTAGVVIKENFKRSDDNTITKQETYTGVWTAKLNGVTIANGADLSLDDNGKTLKLYIGETEIASYTLTVTDIDSDQFIDGLWGETFEAQTGTYDMPTPSSHAAGATDCLKHNTFAGWVLAAKAENPTAGDLITGAAASGVTAANNTYYAVWSKSEDVKEEETITKSTSFVAAGTTLNSDISYSTATNNTNTAPFVANNGHLRLYKPSTGNNGNSITFSAGVNMTLKKVELSTSSGNSYKYVESSSISSGLEDGEISDGKLIRDNLSERYLSIVNVGSNYIEISEMKVTYTKTVTKVDYITDCDPRYDVTFNVNGGEGSYSKVTKKAGVEITLPDGSALSREHYTFKGWTEDEEGEGYLYTTTYTVPGENKTLYAQWDEAPHAYVHFMNGESEVTGSPIKVYDGGTFDLLGAQTADGKAFIGWKWNGNRYKAGQTSQSIGNPAEDRTYTAAWMPVIDVATADAANLSDGKWILVQEKSQLKAGDFIVIAAAGYDAAMSNYQKTSNRGDAAVTKNIDTLSYTSNVAPLFLQYDPENDYYAFYDRAYDTNNDGTADASGYLYSNNNLKTQADINGFQGVWSISITDKKASIVALSNTNDKIMRYNNSDKLFNCYGTTTQKDLAIYKWAKNINGATNVSDVTNTDMVIVKAGATLTIDEAATLDNVTVQAGGTVTVAENMGLEVNNITIESQAGKSGQLIQAEGASATINGALYLDIKLLGDGTGTMTTEQSREWYCISAPFEVSFNDGFFWADGSPMGYNVDFQAFVYDGGKRASNGTSGWQRVSGKMEAGKAYLIGFDDEKTNYKTIRLKAMSNTIPTASQIDIEAHDADAANENWNGVGNPTLHYIALKDFEEKVQCYDNGSGYNPYAPTTHNYVVGTALFMQAENDIDLKAATNGSVRAPRRANAENERYSFCVELAKEGATHCDSRLYVSASDEATSSYEPGKDMLTMNGTSAKFAALIWTENYGKRLASEDVPMVNNKATYSMGIFAPNAGTYTISTTEASENATLYLTKNGRIYWNLTMGACELDLNQGQNNEYGLVLRAEAPAVTTGVDQLDNGNWKLENGVQKVIIDEHVYILRGEQLYGIDGKAVK